jgi:hypothetical protein
MAHRTLPITPDVMKRVQRPIPQAEEARAVPLGAGDGQGDLRKTIESLSVPGKTVL